MEAEKIYQYIRKASLIVANESGEGLDLSGLKISFRISKTDVQTPNTAEIRIYNVSEKTLNLIEEEFTQVTLQAGYSKNFGVIFNGQIKQTRKGKENGTDTFLDLSSADGDLAYNYAIVSNTLKAGSTQADQISLSVLSMEQSGVIRGAVDLNALEGNRLPRGKVLFGQAKKYLRSSSENTESTWSIQNGIINIIKTEDYLNDEAVLLNSKTGLIGTPELTEDGVKGRCLLNPNLGIGARLKINENEIQKSLLPETSKDAPPNQAPSVAKDGVYKIISLDYLGDTFGNDWFTDFVCVDIYEPTAKATA
jgi:hypothetical protein